MFNSGPSRAPAQHAPPPAKPAAQQAPPPAQYAAPAPQGGGMMSGIGSTIAQVSPNFSRSWHSSHSASYLQGFAFGTGSAIAHRAVGAVFGGAGGAAAASSTTPVR
jgi:hypothetical protein